jgi:TrmH family RNA methyltransferase
MEIYSSNECLEEAKKLAASRKDLPIALRVLPETVMSYCSDLSTPPGIIALAKPARPILPLSSVPLVLVLHGVQLPQNVGAMLRTAEGAGVTEVLVTRSTADPYGPKALRGSAGSAFRVPIGEPSQFSDVLSNLRKRYEKINCLAATQNGKVSYDKVHWDGPSALIVGSEGAGFKEVELEQIDQTISIPMKGNVESLNVGIAAAVCLFEAARQRQHGS